MAHGDFKDLPRRTTFDKVLRDKAFNNAENPKYDGYQRSLTSMTVCFYHVTYAFQSESTLYSCLNVKELLARSRREI